MAIFSAGGDAAGLAFGVRALVKRAVAPGDVIEELLTALTTHFPGDEAERLR